MGMAGFLVLRPWAISTRSKFLIELNYLSYMESNVKKDGLSSIFRAIAISVLPWQVFSSVLPARAVETSFCLCKSSAP